MNVLYIQHSQHVLVLFFFFGSLSTHSAHMHTYTHQTHTHKLCTHVCVLFVVLYFCVFFFLYEVKPIHVQNRVCITVQNVAVCKCRRKLVTRRQIKENKHFRAFCVKRRKQTGSITCRWREREKRKSMFPCFLSFVSCVFFSSFHFFAFFLLGNRKSEIFFFGKENARFF